MTRFERISRADRQGARWPAAAILAGLLALAGCTGVTMSPGNKGDLAGEARAAHFDAQPVQMFRAAEAACQGPGERFVRPAPGVAQCHLLMDPETTAALILTFDGDVKNLPRLVISMTETRVADGWVATSCAFVRIPVRDGRVRRVVQSDPRIRRKISEVLERMGGTPMATVPGELAERCYSL